jgi:hypothetical protein
MSPATPSEMEAEMTRYFAAERAESALVLGCAIAAAVVSAALVALRSPYRAMAWPLAAVGLVQLVVGGTVFVRTPGQVARLTEQLCSSPSAYQAAEAARMRRVQRSFLLYRRIEIGLLAIGLALASIEGYGRTLYAAGMGLMLEAGLMLFLDLRAERRRHRYLEMVKTLA